MRRLLCVLFLLLTGPVTFPGLGAIAVVAPAAEARAAAPVPAVSVAPPAQPPKQVAPAPSVSFLGDDPSTRIEVILAVLGIVVAMFGALITAVIVFFAFNIKAAAVDGATREVLKDRDSLYEALERARAKMEQLSAVKQHLENELKEAAERAEAFEHRANRRLLELESRFNGLEARTNATLADFEARGQRAIEKFEAQAVRPVGNDGAAPAESVAKDIRDYNDGDFRREIGEAVSRDDIDEVRGLAATMQRLLSDDRSQVYARFAEGWALEEQGESEKSYAVYDRLIAEFGASNDPEVLEWVGRALFNKGISLGAQNRHPEAIAAYDDLVSRFGESGGSELRSLVARSLLNKGGRLELLERLGDAQIVYQGLVDRFEGEGDGELRRQVSYALYNSAAIAARLGDAKEAVALLRQWLEADGAASSYSLVVDSDFDAIRQDSRFVALLVELQRREEARAES